MVFVLNLNVVCMFQDPELVTVYEWQQLSRRTLSANTRRSCVCVYACWRVCACMCWIQEELQPKSPHWEARWAEFTAVRLPQPLASFFFPPLFSPRLAHAESFNPALGENRRSGAVVTRRQAISRKKGKQRERKGEADQSITLIRGTAQAVALSFPLLLLFTSKPPLTPTGVFWIHPGLSASDDHCLPKNRSLLWVMMLDTNHCLSFKPSPLDSPPMADDMENACLKMDQERLVYHSLKEGGRPADSNINTYPRRFVFMCLGCDLSYRSFMALYE